MNVTVTTFTNPWSFFCIAEEDGKNIDLIPVEPQNVMSSRIELSDVSHGQYVAVMWNNKWARGLVTMESQFRIWLIDYGIYLRPNEKTVYVNLPPTHKKYPTKVFEASIHGVAPMDKTLTEECEIQNIVTNTWNHGCIEKAQSLIASANHVFFVPVALMSTKHNDVVLGDLYLDIKSKGIVNIIDELEMWPVFAQKNKAIYIENLSTHYTSRRKHRACLLKPAFAEDGLPTMTLETTYEEYSAICDNAPQLEIIEECDSASGDGSTVLEYGGTKDNTLYTLSPSEIERYANMYVTVCGREYNVLNVLTNKMRDLNMCEQYKDHDLKSVGRASTRHSPRCNQNFLLSQSL
ncbi:hypothetical protein ABMA28_013380 [Loxostege sticticalis]|uniref:Tudor domain-containing protein n=1 Tax=Loxostege sticticalis TaxID=481309 RepID=A0ABD0TI44_LOXSC